jgi:hypothetical protein
MADETYQGWTNWATWNMNLWLTNDYGTYKQMQHMMRIADSLPQFEDYVERYGLSLERQGMVTDFEPKDLEVIDWYEIAESFAEGEEHSYE